MSYFDITILICTIAGFLFGIFTVVDRLISIKSSKPILEFSIGMSSVLGTDSANAKKSYSTKISTLFLGTHTDRNSLWGFACPYILENNSTLPITNITIALQYLSKYRFNNLEGIKDADGNRLEISVSSDINRNIYEKGERVEVRYNIEVLRPGEKTFIFDALKFQSDDSKHDFLISGLISHLKKVDGFNEICLIDAIVFSEQCPPISKRIKILWFNSNSFDQLSEQVKNAVNAFWAGHYPRSKFYFLFANPFKKKKHLVKKEYADAIIPTLQIFKMTDSKSFYYWRDPEDCEGATIELGMPFFNYYQLTGDISTDDILRQAGFKKIL